MKKINKWALITLLSFLVSACSLHPDHVQMVNQQPDISPDYIGVTIPVDIAPPEQRWESEKYLGTYEAPILTNYPLADCVTCLHSGPLGGDQEIGAMIANGKVDVLIFFCDNLIQQGHQNDVSALTRLASLYNIAFATNRTTADMIITSPLLKDENYKRILPPAIENYKNRKV